MGVVPNISHDKFPQQGKFLNQRVQVCFNYDTSKLIGGAIVRDDTEEPGREIIKLDDGRYVLSTECQYSIDRGVTESTTPGAEPGQLGGRDADGAGLGAAELRLRIHDPARSERLEQRSVDLVG
jgi:hypothetical protein